MKRKAALIVASTLIAGTAIADDTGFYAGAGVGWAQMSIDKSKVTNLVTGAFAANGLPLDTWSASTDDTDINWIGFVGYRFMKYLAVEAGYLDTGTGSYTGRGGTTVFDPDLDAFVSVPVKGKFEWNGTGWPVSVLGIWPINEGWEVFGRVGGFFGEVKEDLRLNAYDSVTGEKIATAKAHDSENSNEFLYGVGVDANFLGTWAARFEWMSMPSLGNNDTGSGDWNAFQFSLLYKFQ